MSYFSQRIKLFLLPYLCRPLLVGILVSIGFLAFAQTGDDPCTATVVTFTSDPCDTTTHFAIAPTSTANTTTTPNNVIFCNFNTYTVTQDRWVKFTVPNYPSSGVRFKAYSQADIVGFALYESPTNNCFNLTLDTCGLCKVPSGGQTVADLGKFSFYFPQIAVGKTYWIRLWEDVPQITPLNLKTGIIVLNDNCVNALPLEGESCNFGASGSEPEEWTPDHGQLPGTNACTGGGWNSNDNAVWYVFDVTPTTQQPITMSVFDVRCFDGFNRLQIGIWTNHNTCDLSQESLVACATGVDTVRIADINLPVGKYYLFMDGSAGAQCRWTFESFQLLGGMTTDAPRCPGEPITLTGNTRIKPNYTYNYRFAGPSIAGVWNNGNIDSYTIANPTAGIYSVTITETAANGSTQTVVGSVTVAVRPLPTPPTLPALALRCGNGCGPIDAGTGSTTAAYAKWYWSNGDSTRVARACAQGSYTVTVSTQYGCSATASTTVDSLLPLQVWAHATYADCEGNNGRIVIDSTRGSLGAPYRFALNAATATQLDTVFGGLRANTYTVWAQDALGCRNSDTVRIGTANEVLPPVLLTTHTHTADCDGQNGTIYIDTIIGGAGQPYTLRLNAGAAQPVMPVLTGLATGSYTLIASDSLHCRDTVTVIVPQIYYPELTVTAATPLITVGDSTRLLPHVTRGHIIRWAWADTQTLNCRFCAQPIALPFLTTTYTVTATDDNTCSVTQTVIVAVQSKLDVYAPTVITPNGDGNNDTFTLYGGRSLSLIKQLRIYDRWGELVFAGNNLEPNSAQAGWDGTLRGQALNTGVFVWQAEVLFSDGRSSTLHGDVTILAR